MPPGVIEDLDERRTNTHYILGIIYMGYLKLPAFTAGPESRVPAIWIL